MASAISSQTHFKTVVTSGAAQSQTTKEKNLLSSEPARVTGASGQAVVDSFTLAEPAPQDPGAQLRAASLQNGSSVATGFNALTADEKSEVKRIMKDLNSKARLFARNEEGELVRISPAHGKERLDRGEAVEVVTRLGQQTSQSASSLSSNRVEHHVFSPNDRFTRNESISKSEVKANYTSSPLADWDSVLWHDGEENLQGIPGTPKLPVSGEPVTLSQTWESKWDSYSEVHSGFFGRHSDINESSNFDRVQKSV
jgi:hypothetical protein